MSRSTTLPDLLEGALPEIEGLNDDGNRHLWEQSRNLPFGKIQFNPETESDPDVDVTQAEPWRFGISTINGVTVTIAAGSVHIFGRGSYDCASGDVTVANNSIIFVRFNPKTGAVSLAAAMSLVQSDDEWDLPLFTMSVTAGTARKKYTHHQGDWGFGVPTR